MQARERFALFGITPNGALIAEGWINLHLLLWKYVIYQLVIVETEDASFEHHAIWNAAWSQFQYRAKAKQESIKSELIRHDSRGNDVPDMTRRGKCMEPIGSAEANGKIVYDEVIVQSIVALTIKPKGPGKRKAPHNIMGGN